MTNVIWIKRNDYVKGIHVEENNSTRFFVADKYNNNKHYIVTRDKNRHYYLRQYVFNKPVGKVTRLHKDFIEDILGIKIRVKPICFESQIVW